MLHIPHIHWHIPRPVRLHLPDGWITRALGCTLFVLLLLLGLVCYAGLILCAALHAW